MTKITDSSYPRLYSTTYENWANNTRRAWNYRVYDKDSIPMCVTNDGHDAGRSTIFANEETLLLDGYVQVAQALDLRR